MDVSTAPDIASVLRSRCAPRRLIDPSPLPDGIERLHDDELLHALLARRGLRTRIAAESFLDHTATAVPDPHLLPDLDAAIERVSRAVLNGENIAIFGDYDVDGITSAAIMWYALRPVVRDERRLLVRLPTRDEGYGLNATALSELAEAGSTLLIAVDCASTDQKHVSLARSLGMDVVIIDHHHMTTAGPEGAITISPARPDGGHYREMAAAGLTWLVVNALEQTPAFSQFHQTGGAAALVDLAALGTVADVSPMTGHNRPIVREGIRAMRRSPRTGLEHLCDVASIDLTTVNTTKIGFGIAPRLNAAGRISDPRPAFELLLTKDPTRAFDLATELNGLNRLRQAETESVIESVVERLLSDQSRIDAPVLVESSSEWRTGILGLAAGKLAERLGRPVILLRDDGKVATGSCRSVPGLHIVDLLRRHDNLLERYGGHSQAAGMTLRPENVHVLREALSNDSVIAHMDLPFVPELAIDAELGHQQITLDTAKRIMQLSPFGAGNPEPVFVIRNVSLLRVEVMGRDSSHLRLVWRGPAGEIRAPFFSAAERAGELSPGASVDVACSLSVDHWNGQPRVDVRVLDFRPGGQ